MKNPLTKAIGIRLGIPIIFKSNFLFLFQQDSLHFQILPAKPAGFFVPSCAFETRIQNLPVPEKHGH